MYKNMAVNSGRVKVLEGRGGLYCLTNCILGEITRRGSSQVVYNRVSCETKAWYSLTAVSHAVSVR